MFIKEFLQKRLRGSIYSAFPFDDLEKDEKYISIFTSTGRLPNGKVVEFNHYKSDNHHLLPNKLSNILGVIDGFKTPYDHASDIENSGMTNFYQALLSLQELQKLGLLISQTEFLDKLSKNDSEFASPNINTLAWITRDRTESIRKSLESFIENTIEPYQGLDFIVFDDSSSENYNTNKQNIELLNRKYKTNIKLVGRTERKVFLNRLIQKLENKVPKHVVEYGLMGLSGIDHRTGANRNTFQLFTSGKFSLLTDDDIFCNISKNGNDQQLTITSDASSVDASTEFFTNQDALNEKVVFENNDPISLHQKLLGQSIGSLTEKYVNQISLLRITPKFVNDNLNSEKRVRVTMMGAAGDSGAGSPISKIFFPANKLVPLISNSENFLSKMYSRTVLQSHNSLTVGSPNFLLGMNLGFDNTELLPPFHPNFRNSDGIFASVLRKCFGNSYIGHLPFAISHIPPDERPVDDSDLTSTSNRIPDVLRFSIDEFNNRSVTTEEGLKSLGGYLRDISKRSDDNLKEYLGLINTSLITSKLNSLEPLYKEYKHLNKRWSEIVEQRIETLYKSLQNGLSSIKFKEIEHLPYEDQLHTIRKIYGNFGDLLYYWPEIYACVATHKKTLMR